MKFFKTGAIIFLFCILASFQKPVQAQGLYNEDMWWYPSEENRNKAHVIGAMLSNYVIWEAMVLLDFRKVKKDTTYRFRRMLIANGIIFSLGFTKEVIDQSMGQRINPYDLGLNLFGLILSDLFIFTFRF